MKRKGIARWFAVWLLLAACVECVHAQARDPLIERMAANENLLLSDISEHAPLVETYLQIMSKNGETPISDRYFLHRIELGRSIRGTLYEAPKVDQSRLSTAMKIARLTVRRAPVSFDASGFLEMLAPDIHGFDPGKFRFEYLRNDFLGGLKTAVYQVVPRKPGYFRGRFWIDDGGHLVRFTGTFGVDSSEFHPRFLHFDSWRYNVKPGVWLPAAVYIEPLLSKTAFSVN